MYKIINNKTGQETHFYDRPAFITGIKRLVGGYTTLAADWILHRRYTFMKDDEIIRARYQKCRLWISDSSRNANLLPAKYTKAPYSYYNSSNSYTLNGYDINSTIGTFTSYRTYGQPTSHYAYPMITNKAPLGYVFTTGWGQSEIRYNRPEYTSIGLSAGSYSPCTVFSVEVPGLQKKYTHNIIVNHLGVPVHSSKKEENMR